MEQHGLSTLHRFPWTCSWGCLEWPLRYRNENKTKPEPENVHRSERKRRSLPKECGGADLLSLRWSGFHTWHLKALACIEQGLALRLKMKWKVKDLEQEVQRALQKKSMGNVCGTLSKNTLSFFSAPLLSLVQNPGLEPPKITARVHCGPGKMFCCSAWEKPCLEMHRESSAQFPDINRAAQSHSEYRKCFLICKWELTLFHRRNYNSWKLANVSRSSLKARKKKKKKQLI